MSNLFQIRNFFKLLICVSCYVAAFVRTNLKKRLDNFSNATLLVSFVMFLNFEFLGTFEITHITLEKQFVMYRELVSSQLSLLYCLKVTLITFEFNSFMFGQFVDCQ